MSKWLVLDVNYLCWRNYHTGMRDLSHNDVPTGSIFGLLKDVLSLENQFDTKNIAFCFDSKESHRKKLFSGYKSDREKKRQEMTQEEHRKYIVMITQIDILRQDILPYLGFRNIFHEEGYEADDMIASFCFTNFDKEMIIVSADQDLYQLINYHVAIWNPTQQKMMDMDKLIEEWGHDIAFKNTNLWPLMKAIAGCKSDSIPGVPGVGEKTAAKFIAGTLKGKKKEQILEAKDNVRKNLRLTTLPFPSTPECHIQKDIRNETSWRKIAKQYGMTSLVKSEPRFRD